MNSIFVSFDEIGWFCLEEILKSGGRVTGIFTLTDEKLEKMSGSKPFDDLAQRYGIELFKINNINDPEALEMVRSCSPDISFVIGWSQLVKDAFISLAGYTCVGMHPTLLPMHRGRAPLPWAIIHGLRKTGVTMFHIDPGADSGDIIGRAEVPIFFEDDAMTLYGRVLEAHVELVRQYYPLLDQKNAPRIVQEETRASYWPKRTPRDGIIDWNTSARGLYDWIRALTRPYPGAFTFYGDRKLIIWKSVLVDESERYDRTGSIVDIDADGLLVTTGEGLIKLTDVQFEDEMELCAGEFLKEDIFEKGRVFE